MINENNLIFLPEQTMVLSFDNEDNLNVNPQCL